MSKIITTIWPPARHRVREAEAARQQEAAEERWREKLAEKKQREAAAERLRIYERHVESVDLNGIATCPEGPLPVSDLCKEVERRLDLAAAAKRDPQIKLADKMSDEDITAIAGKLDPTALHWLLKDDNPERQRKAAKAILDAQADLAEDMSLDRYATIIAEMVARSRVKLRRHRTVVAVMARAILLRSADARWTRQRHGALRPLTAVPYR